MAKNIVLLSDGTSNTFASRTNVRRMVECLAVEDGLNQLVIYGQGVGTREGGLEEFRAYQAERGKPKNLILACDDEPEPGPVKAFWRVLLGQAFGSGLDRNVRQLYSLLAKHYEEGDRVFLFGFSRGAFTVRALAALLYRCRLPPANLDPVKLRKCFDDGWGLLQSRRPSNEVVEFPENQVRCPVHFLGLWDTVKSYGIIDPVMLPHLRHNPIVEHVRHALAIHEHRAFFQHTTWGLLDDDEEAAMTRMCRALPKDDRDNDLELLKKQRENIKEVWFDGYHSDVGGGTGSEISKITLRWMLGEAVNIPAPLRLSHEGIVTLYSQDHPTPTAELVESRIPLYAIAEQLVPRREIENSGVWPEKHWKHGATGKRDLSKALRGGKVFLHDSVTTAVPLKTERCKTNTPPELPD
jgi:uncharacterized protein (DUF2235 family)